MTLYTSCECPHTADSHYLIRCGCPNSDRDPDHPMYQMDDGFHRIWCSDCLRYCHQPPDCPIVSSTARRRPIIALLMAFKASVRVIVTFMFTTLGRIAGPVIPKKRWHRRSY